jgi:hypothetical protein
MPGPMIWGMTAPLLRWRAALGPHRLDATASDGIVTAAHDIVAKAIVANQVSAVMHNLNQATIFLSWWRRQQRLTRANRPDRERRSGEQQDEKKNPPHFCELLLAKIIRLQDVKSTGRCKNSSCTSCG